MGGNNKNIRSRKAIRKALPTMPQPFTLNDLATACGYGVRQVGGLINSIEGVRKEKVERGDYRFRWWYEPK